MINTNKKNELIKFRIQEVKEAISITNKNEINKDGFVFLQGINFINYYKNNNNTPLLYNFLFISFNMDVLKKDGVYKFLLIGYSMEINNFINEIFNNQLNTHMSIENIKNLINVKLKNESSIINIQIMNDIYKEYKNESNLFIYNEKNIVDFLSKTIKKHNIQDITVLFKDLEYKNLECQNNSFIDDWVYHYLN